MKRTKHFLKKYMGWINLLIAALLVAWCVVIAYFKWTLYLPCFLFYSPIITCEQQEPLYIFAYIPFLLLSTLLGIGLSVFLKNTIAKVILVTAVITVAHFVLWHFIAYMHLVFHWR